MVKKTTRQLREELNSKLASSHINLGECIKAMRKITGKTQLEYAKYIGVNYRIIIDLENNKGNPTLSTLKKIGKPFGLEIFFGRILGN